MIRAALIAAVLAAPVQAQAPDPIELLGRFDTIVAEGGGMALEFELTRALDAARAEGALDADWARVMAVAAVQIMAGLARYERGFALLDEAESLVAEGSELRDFILAWRGYFELWWGHGPRGRATLARLTSPLDELLDPEEIAFVTAHRDDPEDVAGSDGFERASKLADDAAQLLIAGDIDQAEQLLRGLRLPEGIASKVPLVAVYNAVIAINFFTADLLRGNPEAARSELMRALADVTTGPPEARTVRPDLLADPDTRTAAQTVLFSIASNLDRPEDAALREMLLDALRPGEDASADHRANWALQRADEAIERADWREAAAQAEAALATGTLDAEDALSWRVQAEVFRARANYAAGQPTDAEALVGRYVEIADATDLRPLLKVARTAQIVSALYRAGEHRLTGIIGRDLFAYLASVQAQTLQSGETVAAMAAFWRQAADHTIAAGFVMAHYPPDGEAAPEGGCQTFMEIQMCTALLP